MRRKAIVFGIGLLLAASFAAPRHRPARSKRVGAIRPTPTLQEAVTDSPKPLEGIEAVMTNARAGTVLTVSLMMIGAALLLFGRWGGISAFTDALAYMGPIAAAIFAGMTVYREGAKGLLFLTTVFFLYLGTVAYMTTRGHGANVLTVTTLLGMLVINLTFIATAARLTKASALTRSRKDFDSGKFGKVIAVARRCGSALMTMAALPFKSLLIITSGAMRTAGERRLKKAAPAEKKVSMAQVIGAWTLVVAVSLLVIKLAFFADVVSKCIELPQATPECFDYWQFPWPLDNPRH